MTITYPNGRTVAAVVLYSDNGVMRVAVEGQDDVRVFRQVDGVWHAEDGQRVEMGYAWQKEAPAQIPDESHFICSKELGRQLISSLMNGSEISEGAPAPLYVFSGEKRRVRITVLRGQQRLAG